MACPRCGGGRYHQSTYCADCGYYAAPLDASMLAAAAQVEQAWQKPLGLQKGPAPSASGRNAKGTLREDGEVVLDGCVVLGGFGTALEPGSKCVAAFSNSRFAATQPRQPAVVWPVNSLQGIDIGGRGRVTSNAGLIGGGFGVAGAVEGIVAATLINAITQKSSIETVVGIWTADRELWLLSHHAEPAALRIMLAATFAGIRSSTAAE